MSMRSQLAGIGIAVFLCSPWSYAQESLVGTYKGSIEVPTLGGKGRTYANIPVILEITSAENGKLVGKFSQGGSCRGDYSVDGTYEGAKLDIKVGEGAVKGCGNSKLNVTAQSNKLVGKWGRNDIELSK